MRRTIVICSATSCDKPATAKIAAPWSYGSFQEYKTYGFACVDHVEEVKNAARNRHAPARLDQGETIGEIEAYSLKDA